MKKPLTTVADGFDNSGSSPPIRKGQVPSGWPMSASTFLVLDAINAAGWEYADAVPFFTEQQQAKHIELLFNLGYLDIDRARYGSLKLTPRGVVALYQAWDNYYDAEVAR